MPIYFDHNATTPLKKPVWEGLYSSLEKTNIPQNPSSIHGYGRKAKELLEESRERVARAFEVEDPERLFFTASATESINTAIKGSFFAASGTSFHFISTEGEHEAGLEASKFIQSKGAKLRTLELDKKGNFSLEQLKECLHSIREKEKDSPILCSFMAANNETGKIYPVKEIGEICRSYDAFLHVDATQTGGKIASPFSIKEVNASLVTLSSHKIGGPQGVGALYVEKNCTLLPLLEGGSQERKRRAGTHNVLGILGFSLAANLLKDYSPLLIEKLRNSMEESLVEKIPDLHIVCKGEDRLLNTSNFMVPGVEGHSLLMSLDLEGIAVSSGSACSSGSTKASHVLLAMGYGEKEALSSIRVSLGEENTQEEVEHFCSILPSIVERIQRS